ncbi:MAG: hypothetical protein J6Z49_08935 [Kiritimatiellae bacterium]|nr:hypothetical protein [Kiritimatiellia bacterium]
MMKRICHAAVAVCAAALSPVFAEGVSGTPIKEVILASKNHLDVGFTCTVPALMRRIRTSDAEGVLNLLDADRSKPEAQWIRWTLPAWSMDIMLDGTYAPERRARLEEAVRTRRLLCQAMPFTIEAEASDLEEMVRLLSYGSDISRRFGIDLPRHAKQSDVPEQAWAMPTVLAQAGVKFLHIGINQGCKQNGSLSKIPPLCWWEGPDGSRILLGYCPNYGEVRGSPKFTVPKGWKHRTYLAYYMRGDNQGPISTKDAEAVMANVRKAIPGVKVRFGDPGDFADAIIAEEKEKPRLPVIRGDMPDTWIHGQMTAPEETAIHRHAQTELITLGVLDTTLRALGIKTKPVSRVLDHGYRKSGLYSEHTWGLSCGRERKHFHDPDWRERYERGDFKYIDSAFEYHKDYARDAHRIAQDGIKERMTALARAVDVEGPRIVVFNPLPYARDAEVEVEMPKGYSLPGGVRDGGKVKFLAKGLPADGYKTFAVSRVENLEVLERLENLEVLDGQPMKFLHFTVRFNLEKGGIASLVENATGRELVKQGGHALGQFLHERFSLNEVKRFVYSYNRGPQRRLDFDFGKGGMPDTNKITYAAMTPKNWTAKHVRTALGEEVTLTAGDTLGLAKGFEIRFSFPDHAACVDISWRVTDKTPDPTPEGGWICLPFNVSAPSFRVGRIGGTINPAKDIIFFSNRNLMCVDRAITVRNGATGAGMGVASADLPLWSLGKPGLWRYEPDYVPTEPEVFANLYNNQWNTNFPFWIPGSWTASLRVYPVAEGADEEQAMFTPAWEIRQPCVAAFAEGSDLATKVAKDGGDGVAVSRRGVRVTAFCPNPDGRGTVLRVWEQAGTGGAITVTLSKGMKATEARPVNLRGERAGDPIPIRDGKFSFDLGAWAPKSFILFGAAEEACGAAAYRFYRFAADLTGGGGLQISELKLYSGVDDITQRCSAVRYEEATFASQFKKGFNPLKALDGNLGTKWYDDRAATERRETSGKDVWVVLEYAEPVAVTRYEWYTADDTSRYGERNPVAWRLQGSNDGKSWNDLDVVACARPHTFDKTLAYSRRLDVPRELPENVIVYPMSIGDGRRLVSYDVNGTTIHELMPAAK